MHQGQLLHRELCTIDLWRPGLRRSTSRGLAAAREGDVRAEWTVLCGKTVSSELLDEVRLERGEFGQVSGEVNPQDARRAGAAEVARGAQSQGSTVTVLRRLATHRLECLQPLLRLFAKEGQRDVQQRVVHPAVVAALPVVRFQAAERRLNLRGEFDREEESHLIER